MLKLHIEYVCIAASVVRTMKCVPCMVICAQNSTKLPRDDELHSGELNYLDGLTMERLSKLLLSKMAAFHVDKPRRFCMAAPRRCVHFFSLARS